MPIKKINTLVESYLSNITSTRKNRLPTSERSVLLEEICTFLFDKKDFKKILGQTKIFTVKEIRDIYSLSKKAKNPPAYFWKLLRNKQQNIAKHIAEEYRFQKMAQKDIHDGLY
ncbi:MAG: hypothetical protein QM526_02305 [Alphaproteobacteria bacterium]|nr:hypothetical protein [Alphaproteobacteria bacterium]